MRVKGRRAGSRLWNPYLRGMFRNGRAVRTRGRKERQEHEKQNSGKPAHGNPSYFGMMI